jgi:hypothetical protein
MILTTSCAIPLSEGLQPLEILELIRREIVKLQGEGAEDIAFDIYEGDEVYFTYKIPASNELELELLKNRLESKLDSIAYCRNNLNALEAEVQELEGRIKEIETK